MNATSFATLDAALAGARKAHCKHLEEAIATQVNKLIEQLAAVNWDLDKFAPYPHGSLTRKAYKQALSRRNFAVRWTATANPHGYHRPGQPNLVTMRASLSDLIAARAEELAREEFDGYVAKLAGKIDKDIATASLVGDLWEYSQLSVTCADGEVQTWTTKCILNQSCLGTLFHQWPTRRL